MGNAVEIVTSLLTNIGSPSLCGNRVYPVIAKRGAELPNIVVTQISENDLFHLSGVAAGYPESRISVISRGRTATEMMNVSDDVKAALDDVVHQTVGSFTDVTIRKAGPDVTQSYFDPDIFEQTTDFYVRWRSS